MRERRRIPLPPAHMLLASMVLFVAWFSAYSIATHDAHDTHKADLGQIDLAIWNTAHGRFLQEIKDDQVSTRLTDHVEPIFLPVSLVFWVWDDVRALLVLQAAALAAGAWPIYLLARHRLRSAGYEASAEWGGLAIGIAYLLTPALQAAAVAEFHALPLAAPLVAWALWMVDRRQWGRFGVAILLLLSVQEGMALLAALLGGYALVVALRLPPAAGVAARRSRRIGMMIGTGAILVSAGWFCATTFVIIPTHAAQVYDVARTPYAARYGELGDSFIDVLVSLVARPGVVLRIVTERMRLRYLFGLLAPTAFLGLLGPEILLLSLPLLLANLLSSFPFQYAGVLHYSAPLVPYFTAAAAWGLPRFLDLANRERDAIVIRGQLIPKWTLGAGLIVAIALAHQVSAGYTPIGRVFWLAGGWPKITPHDRLLTRFAAQIPADAALTATTDLYPHLSHRERIYQFPWMGEASWALVDVTGTTDRHPNDVRAEIDRLMASGWGVVDAAGGYLLLAMGRGESSIPDAFYDFLRVPADALPEHEVDIRFGDALHLVGYDIIDDAQWRQTRLRYTWRVLAPAPEALSISAQVLTPDGVVADDTAVRPMPALVWYPPSRWQAGETIVTETAAWYLPRVWAPVLAVRMGEQRLPVIMPASGEEGAVGPDGRVMLKAWARRGGRLRPFPGPLDVFDASARFSSNEWSVRLEGWSAPLAVAPGQDLPVMLAWHATEPAPMAYTVFLHLRTENGQAVANGDATPNWFVPWPTTRWRGVDGDGFSMWDAHSISVPAGLPPGRYDLVVGWYYWETGARLTVMDELGNVAGDAFVLGPVTVDTAAALPPDLPCLVAPEACASQ